MSASRTNPCLGCATNCCTSISSLRVSRNEFDRCFAAHRERVRILHDGPILELAMVGGVCPHFDRQCTAYEGRPVECLLFPYTTHRIRASGPFVLVSYHARVVCPIRTELLPSDLQAREMMRALVRDAYGERRRPLLFNENAPLYRFMRRVYFVATGRAGEWRGPVTEPAPRGDERGLPPPSASMKDAASNGLDQLDLFGGRGP